MMDESLTVRETSDRDDAPRDDAPRDDALREEAGREEAGREEAGPSAPDSSDRQQLPSSQKTEAHGETQTDPSDEVYIEPPRNGWPADVDLNGPTPQTAVERKVYKRGREMHQKKAAYQEAQQRYQKAVQNLDDVRRGEQHKKMEGVLSKLDAQGLNVDELLTQLSERPDLAAKLIQQRA